MSEMSYPILQGIPGVNGTNGEAGEPGRIGRPGKQVCMRIYYRLRIQNKMLLIFYLIGSFWK